MLVKYNDKNEEKYECDFCGVELTWDETDHVYGEMWGCEKCGKSFCSKCFIDKFGNEKYMDMMQNHDLILCPTCFNKE